MIYGRHRVYHTDRFASIAWDIDMSGQEPSALSWTLSSAPKWIVARFLPDMRYL